MSDHMRGERLELNDLREAIFNFNESLREASWR